MQGLVKTFTGKKNFGPTLKDNKIGQYKAKQLHYFTGFTVINPKIHRYINLSYVVQALENLPFKKME